VVLLEIFNLRKPANSAHSEAHDQDDPRTVLTYLFNAKSSAFNDDAHDFSPLRHNAAYRAFIANDNDRARAIV
jgi:hypothetical protein